MIERIFLISAFLLVLTAPQLSIAQMGGCRSCNGNGNDTRIAGHIKQADLLHSQFKSREAAVELQKVLRLEPQNLEALAKLSRAHIDIGDSIPESQADWKERKIREYRKAENFARRAINADPNSTWGHFYLAASLGTMAGVSPVKKQIAMAEEIRSHAEKAIALNPSNGFAYHVYGVWHRRMAELDGMSRMFVTVLYGRSLPGGSLEESVKFLEKAVAINPDVIVSRLELARSHVAMEEWSAARTLLESIAELPVKFSDDGKHKQKAQELLEDIKNR